MLATMSRRPGIAGDVSVAGCLGYDVLGTRDSKRFLNE